MLFVNPSLYTYLYGGSPHYLTSFECFHASTRLACGPSIKCYTYKLFANKVVYDGFIISLGPRKPLYLQILTPHHQRSSRRRDAFRKGKEMQNRVTYMIKYNTARTFHV